MKKLAITLHSIGLGLSCLFLVFDVYDNNIGFACFWSAMIIINIFGLLINIQK